MTSLRQQLAPCWSPVNIVIAVVLFLSWVPLGLAMIAYIVFGKQVNLDFGRWLERSRTGNRVIDAFNAATSSWSASAKGGKARGVNGSTGKPVNQEPEGD